MQCCGTPFADGDSVEWTISTENDVEWLTRVLGAKVAQSIDLSEEHHESSPVEASPLKGVVEQVRSVRCRFAPVPGGEPNRLVPVADSGELTVVHAADGWDAETHELRFNGYIVELTVPDSPLTNSGE
jgi:hypothetical protein